MSLGKTDDAIKTPIPIQLKHGDCFNLDKKGLGTSMNSPPKQKFPVDNKHLKERFQSLQGKKWDTRWIEKDLRKARIACQDLDEKADVVRHVLWLPEEVPEPSEFDELEPGIQLMAVNDYLRNQYLYCIWCGCVYDDKDDLAANCPGETRQDHDE